MVPTPITGEVFPTDSPYNQPEIIRTLFFALDKLKALGENGNQGLSWNEKEDTLLAQCFTEGTKITGLARLLSRTYVAIKARLLKLELLQK
nr:hypothetical protein [uncultured Pedobacter sp.]